jgi:oligopeptide/dipeptide ABC transporter ATP-binding protein
MTQDDLVRPTSADTGARPLEAGTDLLSLRDVQVEFRESAGLRNRRVLRAVNGVGLELKAGESVAVVGESGSGKTTLGRVVCRLQRVTAGQVMFRGQDVEALRGAELAAYRRSVQMIFQDPYGSLDPRLRVGPIIAEPLTVNRIGSSAERRARVAALLHTVGLPEHLAGRFPHELSGGQRQRVAIARVLAVSPQLIVADEPTSALDVSAQAQTLSLLDRLRRELSLSLIYITHNLPTAAYVADRAAVMYMGRIIESGPVTEVLLSPRHPYTAALSAAAPTLDALEQEQDLSRQEEAAGELPDPANPPSGCTFHPRCWLRPQVDDHALCERQQPELSGTGAAGHLAACHFSQLMREMPAPVGQKDSGRDA